MRIKRQDFGKLLIVAVYIISFVCFLMTSVFDNLGKVLGSNNMAFVVVNVAAALIFLTALPIGIRLNIVLYIVCGIFYFPVIFSYSRLDWIEKITTIKFSCSIPAALTAFLLLVVISALLINRNLTKLNDSCKVWEENGAPLEGVREAYRNQTTLYTCLVSGFAVFVAVMIVFGFLVIQIKTAFVEPSLIVLFGVLIAALCIFIGTRGRQSGLK